MNTSQTTAITPIQEVRNNLTAMGQTFNNYLPKSITLDKFIDAAMTGLQTNPALLNADRESFYITCRKAAQDGLLLDGKEAAPVIYNVNVAPKGQPAQWKQKVQYMPMLEGLKKKIYSTGLTETIEARVVYQNELKDFIYSIDEQGTNFNHTPMVFGEPGEAVGAYAKTVIKETGELVIEFIRVEEIAKIREASKSKDSGPWASWWTEMAKKSAIRRLVKRLPQAEQLKSIIEHDNETYNLKQIAEVAQAVEHISQDPDDHKPKGAVSSKLKAKIIDAEPQPEKKVYTAGDSKPVPPPPPAEVYEEELF